MAMADKRAKHCETRPRYKLRNAAAYRMLTLSPSQASTRSVERKLVVKRCAGPHGEHLAYLVTHLRPMVEAHRSAGMLRSQLTVSSMRKSGCLAREHSDRHALIGH